ncbi:MAG: CRISPR-associated endonuclease Cas2 [Leptospiraceae bacterium]|nr:CRISPR-associated endonuclease Cas2 [Leptospiraceae bacterium]
MKNKLYVICYDFPATREGNKRRTRTIRILKGHGIRVQHSVFEGRFGSKEELETMINRIRVVMKKAEDSVRIYPLNEITEKEIKILGQGEVFERKSVYIF